MDIRKVKKLIELLDESGIAEIEITEGEEAVRISRYAPGASAPVMAAPAPAAPAAPAPAGRARRCRAPAEPKKTASKLRPRWSAPFTLPHHRAPRRTCRSAIASTKATRCASSKP